MCSEEIKRKLVSFRERGRQGITREGVKGKAEEGKKRWSWWGMVHGGTDPPGGQVGRTQSNPRPSVPILS